MLEFESISENVSKSDYSEAVPNGYPNPKFQVLPDISSIPLHDWVLGSPQQMSEKTWYLAHYLRKQMVFNILWNTQEYPQLSESKRDIWKYFGL